VAKSTRHSWKLHPTRQYPARSGDSGGAPTFVRWWRIRNAPVLRLSRPPHKCLAGAFKSSPAEELGKREARAALSVGGQRNQRGEDGLSFLEADADLSAVAAMPAERGAMEALRFLISKQEAKLEGFRKADVLKLGGRREGFGDVAAIEGAAETVISGALRRHERMFAEAQD
jgi:hypothetical protein